MDKLKKKTWIIISATLFYLLNRASNDIPKHNEYWKTKSTIFLITDFLSTILLAYIIDYLTDIYRKVCEKKKLNLYLEYLILILLSDIFCYIVAFCRGMLVHGKMYSFEQVAVVYIIAPLFFGLFYAFKKHISEKEKQQILLKQQNELKHEKLQTELQSLRAQYHPHFLFNALNTIYFLIDPQNKRAREAVETLSEILRYQVKCAGDKVPLQDEIEYIRKDIAMRKLRSSNQLILNIDIEEDKENRYIYPLLFIPMIENAFKYVGGDYIINISMHIDNNTLIFEVTNSLPDDYNSNERANGTGLSNLRRRLGILYPNKFSFECSITNNDHSATLKIDLL